MKMRLIQPLKFRTLKTGCFKMPRLQTHYLQMAIFETGITVASGLYLISIQFQYIREPESVTNCNEYMTGTFVYIKLGYLQNLMKNKCSMKCL